MDYRKRELFNRTIHILLVEDDAVDAEAIIRGFRRQRISNPFTVASDGIEALNALRGKDGHPLLPRPYLILLDIKLPRMDGLEFLRLLRQDSDLKRSVVFVLTNSNRDEDKLAAYDERIAGYLIKSKAGKDFVHLIELLDTYWRVVEFPPDWQVRQR